MTWAINTTVSPVASTGRWKWLSTQSGLRRGAIAWRRSLFHQQKILCRTFCTLTRFGTRESKVSPLYNCNHLSVCCLTESVPKLKTVSSGISMNWTIDWLRSMYRDNQDEDKIAQWKKFALSESCHAKKYQINKVGAHWNWNGTFKTVVVKFVSVKIIEVEFEYCVASSDQEIYFLTTNLRQSFAVDKETMYHTSLQRMFSVIACKSRMEKIHGPLSNTTNHYYDGCFWISPSGNVFPFS